MQTLIVKDNIWRAWILAMFSIHTTFYSLHTPKIRPTMSPLWLIKHDLQDNCMSQSCSQESTTCFSGALEVNKAEVLHQIREWKCEAGLLGIMHYTMYIWKMNTAIFNNSEEAEVLIHIVDIFTAWPWVQEHITLSEYLQYAIGHRFSTPHLQKRFPHSTLQKQYTQTMPWPRLK